MASRRFSNSTTRPPLRSVIPRRSPPRRSRSTRSRIFRPSTWPAPSDTAAYIGDNSSALGATGATADDLGVTPASSGWVSALTTNVAALSVGRLTTVGVAAEASNNTPSPSDPPAVQPTEPSGPGYLAAAAAFFKNAGASISAKISNAYNNLTNDVSGPVQGG